MAVTRTVMQVALAQVRPRKADYAENLRRVGAVLEQGAAWDVPPALVVFGETVMSGYFLEGGVREVAVSAGTLYRDLAAQHRVTGGPPVEVCLGFYEEYQNHYYNSALYASLGGPDAGIRHVHRKIFLPTYGLFDEQRFVEAGRTVHAFDTRWGRAAMLICEDVWHSTTATLAALDGAQMILVPSASPARGVAPIGSGANNVEAWNRIMRVMAAEHGVYAALVQIVGFEGGKGFQGRSVLVAPDGEIMVEGPEFAEAIVRAPVERRALTRARADQPLLADLESALPALLARGKTKERSAAGYDPACGPSPPIGDPGRASLAVIEPGTGADPLAVNGPLLERWLTTFLREEVTVRRGFEKGLVALSGGVDSAVTAALAARALGAVNVVGVRLPYRSSSPDSLRHAEQVATQLGIGLETIDITPAVDGLVAAAGDDGDAARRGNVMARTRMIALFDLAAKLGALPLGTGNKTERLLGYFTWHADDAPPVNPLGDLFKTQVWALARHLGIPDEVVSKPATADLVQGQTDEADLGIAYARADFILHWLLTGLTPAEVAERGFDARDVALVKRRLDATHWKRRLPTVAMVSGTAIGESYLRPVDY